MLEYDRIDISEGTDINKTTASNECDVCHYWYFTDIGFKYESYLCNSCHDLMQKAMSFNDTAVVYVKDVLTEFTFGHVPKVMQLA